MKKRVLSLLLTCVMLLGLLPATALADNEAPTTPAQEATATVNFTAQAGGAFLCAPQFDVEVSSKEAENFGYNDSVTNGVSALDVLVKAHELTFGDDFTKDSADAYLVVPDTGYVTTIFGEETKASGFALNGGYPNDGTESQWGGYNGTTVTTQAVVDGDTVEFFIDQDQSAWTDNVAWFCQNGVFTDTIVAKPAATVDLLLKSTSYKDGYLYRDAEAMHNAGSIVKGAQLAWVNITTGEVTAIENAVTDETGKVTLTMPADVGTSYLTAYKNSESNPLVMSLTKVVADNNAVEADPCALSSLVVKGYPATGYEQEVLTLTPEFSPEITAYSTAERPYGTSVLAKMLIVSPTAANSDATIKATLNGENEKDFSSQAVQNFNTMVPGQDNVLTITVTHGDGDTALTKTYTVTVPMAPDPTMATLTLSGLHSAQVNSLKLYTYTGGNKGTTDLLASKTAADGKYTLTLAAGDYWVEGYDANGDCNGGVKITVAEGQTVEYKIQRIYQITTNSGWVEDTDYTLNVTVKDANGMVRPSEVGQATSWGTMYPSCIFVVGDTVTATVTPDSEKHPTHNAATATKTPNMNDSLSASCNEFVAVTFTAPAGSTITAGTLAKYYVYTYAQPFTAPTTADGKVTVTYHFDKNTDYFYRVQNPDGVTYWNYKRWSDGETINVTEKDLYIGDNSFNKDTVINDFSKNVYDRADIYLNINAAGYKNMAVGETFELNSFRNWFAIESFFNAKVALPDMHYQVINADGSPSDVVTITPDAKNSNVATMTANKAGTAIVLVTYDAMTHMAGQSSTDSKQFSAIWPECTGVFVVTVGADGTGIQTNMQIDRLDESITKEEQKTLDAEHDILFYLDDAGAEYSFKPESGCTVTVARSTVSDKMTFHGFTSEGVTVAGDGTVTVSGLTTGRHIIKVEKNGVANYQVVTARKVSYKLVDKDGKELTEEAKTNIKAGDTVNLQFSGLLNPKEKLSGAYNFNFRLHYRGEDGTYFDSNPGGNSGVYDFSGNPARQRISITIPKYWDGDSYTLVAGALKQGGFSGVPTHRGITYAVGTNPQFNAPSVSGILSRLPGNITIPLAKTDFITGKLTFQDEKGTAIDRSKVIITLKDSTGNATTVGADGSFKAMAETYTYTINAAGYRYTTGSVTVTAENKEFTVSMQSAPTGTWDGITITEPQKDGDVYVVKTGAELAWLSAKVADKTMNTFSAKLANDIDLGNYPWTAINTTSSSYVFTLDGAGHEISGLNAAKGLFGTVGGASEIKNLTVSGVLNTADGSVGGIVNYLQSGKITGCVSKVAITVTGSGKTNIGGIAGYMYNNAQIINCVNRGTVTAKSGKQVGGIVGGTLSNTAAVTGCYNTGTVTGTSEVGGILGGTTNSATVTNCYNTGAVTGTGANVGGVIGKTGGNVSSCYNVGTVTGGKGFAGSVSGTVTLCYALTEDDKAQVLTEAAMKSAELGSGFQLICNGYPALAWQTDVTPHTSDGHPTVTAPTCTERGYTTYTCINCGETYVTDYVNATGHTEGDDVTVYPAYKTYTCTACKKNITAWNDVRLSGMTLPTENASNITMRDNGAYPWTWNAAANQLESGNVGVNNSTSETSVTFTLTYGGTLKFHYEVSSENGYDKMTVKLGDETLVSGISGTTAGDADKALSAGTYTLTLSYNKDAASASGDDMGRISNVVLTALTEQEAADAANQQAAAAVTAAIGAIGEVTLDKEQAIKDARAAYNALTDTQKALVTNEGTLTAAEAKLANLKNPSTPTTPPAENKIRVTFRLIGSTKAKSAVELSKGVSGYNGAEYVTWIRTTTYTLDKNATVGTLFAQAMSDAGLSYTGLENNYISAITAPSSCGGYTLSEMDNGANSGWMYTVNGSHPNRGLNDWTLFDGDAVVWHYVDDYAYEVADWADPDYPGLGDGTLHNKWLEAADVTPVSTDTASGADQKAASEVIDLISAIGTVTKDSGDQIKAARSAYDKLTDAQKKLVSNYNVLTEAEAAFAKLNTGLPFADIKVSDYYCDAVKWAVEQGITNGTTDTTFSPNEGCTRGQMVTFLWRAAGSPEPTGKTNLFTDVKADAYYYKALLWAIENGITTGTTDTTFSPDEICARGQMAAFLYRSAKSPAVTGSTSFTDVETDVYYRDAVAWAFQQGITKGATDTTFAPDETCTRGQMVTFLYRYLAK